VKLQFVFALGLSLALTGAGCGTSAVPTAPKAINANPAPAQRAVPQGEFQFPADFPTDFPKYANASIFSAISDSQRAVMSLKSSDESGIILSWYHQAFVTAGYTADENASRGTVTSQSYLKGNIKFVVNADNQGDKNPKTLFSVTRQDLSVK